MIMNISFLRNLVLAPRLSVSFNFSIQAKLF
jgi:hypothetical protein